MSISPVGMSSRSLSIPATLKLHTTRVHKPQPPTSRKERFGYPRGPQSVWQISRRRVFESP